MSSELVLTIGGFIFGSTGLFALIQFLITRSDKKKDKTDEKFDSLQASMDGLKTDISDLRSDMSEMQTQFQEAVATLDDKIDKDIAIQARIRILRACDELRQDGRHSYEFFRQLNRDITVYTNYYNSHPDFKNNEAVSSIEYINRVYQDCLDRNNFLS